MNLDKLPKKCRILIKDFLLSSAELITFSEHWILLRIWWKLWILFLPKSTNEHTILGQIQLITSNGIILCRKGDLL